MAEETSQAPLETGARPRLPRTGILDLVTPLESCVQTVAREYDALHMANGRLFTPNGLRNAIKDSASAVRRCLKCLQGSSSTKATAFNEFYSFVNIVIGTVLINYLALYSSAFQHHVVSSYCPTCAQNIVLQRD